MSFGTRLKRLRLEREWTQAYVGEKVGVSDRVIGYYETDNRFPKDGSVLKALADLFDVSIDYLIGKSDMKKPPQLTKKDKKDIQKELEQMVADLNSGQDGPAFYGGNMELSDYDRAVLTKSLDEVLHLIKLRNKEKYTPKKHKEDLSNGSM
jgi:transcriptional regulator with XRE-family HTH domain